MLAHANGLVVYRHPMARAVWCGGTSAPTWTVDESCSNIPLTFSPASPAVAGTPAACAVAPKPAVVVEAAAPRSRVGPVEAAVVVGAVVLVVVEETGSKPAAAYNHRRISAQLNGVKPYDKNASDLDEDW